MLFQKWLKENAGKTYADAIKAYFQILEEKKKGKTDIDRQFDHKVFTLVILICYLFYCVHFLFHLMFSAKESSFFCLFHIQIK